jgi:hypothetical protein
MEEGRAANVLTLLSFVAAEGFFVASRHGNCGSPCTWFCNTCVPRLTDALAARQALARCAMDLGVLPSRLYDWLA